MSERLSLFSYAKAGYYYWTPVRWDAEQTNGGGFSTGFNAGALFRMTGPFTVGLSFGYDYLADLYNGMNVNLAVSLDFPGLEGANFDVDIKDIKIIPLYPVLYGYGEKHRKARRERRQHPVLYGTVYG